METIKKLYHSIGEVSEITGIKPYVLRYWETEFPRLSPAKNRAGNRTYTDKDVATIQEIRRLLYDEKFTIEGARQYFRNSKAHIRSRSSALSAGRLPSQNSKRDRRTLQKVFRELQSAINELLEVIREQR